MRIRGYSFLYCDSFPILPSQNFVGYGNAHPAYEERKINSLTGRYLSHLKSHVVSGLFIPAGDGGVIKLAI